MQLRVPLLPAWLRWSGVLATATVIFYLSIVTVPSPDQVIVPGRPSLVPLDKWRHFAAYGALAGSLAYATVDLDRPTRQRLLAVVVVTVAYGVGIEFGQSTIPDRYFSLEDAYANALGAFLVLPWYLVRSHVEFEPVLGRLALTG
jgi:VanZ family protein